MRENQIKLLVHNSANKQSLIHKDANMQSIKTLIDKAVIVCGTATALAERLEIQKSVLSEIRNGKRTIAPDIAILIAEIAHEDVRDAALAAVIQNTNGTPRGEQIKAILGKALLVGALAASASQSAHSAYGVVIATEQEKIPLDSVTLVTQIVRKIVNEIYIVEYVYARSIRNKLSNVIHWFSKMRFYSFAP